VAIHRIWILTTHLLFSPESYSSLNCQLSNDIKDLFFLFSFLFFSRQIFTWIEILVYNIYIKISFIFHNCWDLVKQKLTTLDIHVVNKFHNVPIMFFWCLKCSESVYESEREISTKSSLSSCRQILVVAVKTEWIFRIEMYVHLKSKSNRFTMFSFFLSSRFVSYF